MKHFFISLAILLLAIIITYAPHDYEWFEVSYTVTEGDTLWDICQDYCPNGMDIRDYISLVREHNGGISATVYVGQHITLLQEV